MEAATVLRYSVASMVKRVRNGWDLTTEQSEWYQWTICVGKCLQTLGNNHQDLEQNQAVWPSERGGVWVTFEELWSGSWYSVFTLALIPEWNRGISILHQEGYSKEALWMCGRGAPRRPASEKEEPGGQVFWKWGEYGWIKVLWRQTHSWEEGWGLFKKKNANKNGILQNLPYEPMTCALPQALKWCTVETLKF